MREENHDKEKKCEESNDKKNDETCFYKSRKKNGSKESEIESFGSESSVQERL
jgi:hypothetical protein